VRNLRRLWDFRRATGAPGGKLEFTSISVYFHLQVVPLFPSQAGTVIPHCNAVMIPFHIHSPHPHLRFVLPLPFQHSDFPHFRQSSAQSISSGCEDGRHSLWSPLHRRGKHHKTPAADRVLHEVGWWEMMRQPIAHIAIQGSVGTKRCTRGRTLREGS